MIRGIATIRPIPTSVSTTVGATTIIPNAANVRNIQNNTLKQPFIFSFLSTIFQYQEKDLLYPKNYNLI